MNSRKAIIGLAAFVVIVIGAVVILDEANEGPLEEGAESIEDSAEDVADDIEDGIDNQG